jgi:hypothetical protein
MNCNPAGPYHFIKKKFIDRVKDLNALRIHFLMTDNPSLSQKTIARYKRQHTGVFYDRNILGLWVLSEGIIYDNFDAKTMIKDKPEDVLPLRYYVSIDYGTQNACVFLLWAECSDGKSYCLDEYYYSGRDKKIQKTDSEYAKDLIDFLSKHNIAIRMPYIVVDPSAASFIAELRSKKFKVIKANNAVLDGIRTTKSALSHSLLFFSPKCKKTIEEFSSYIWDEKASLRGEDKPMKEHDHCLTGDTLIDTPTGQLPIKDLVGKTGEVWCFDMKCKKKTISTFHDVRKTQENADIYEIETVDGRKIKATGNHRILTEFGWKQLQEIEVDDLIIDISQEKFQDEEKNIHVASLAPKNSKVKSVKYLGKEDVYNMEVKKHHNFSINGGLIVHNCMDGLRYYVYTILIRKYKRLREDTQ